MHGRIATRARLGGVLIEPARSLGRQQFIHWDKGFEDSRGGIFDEAQAACYHALPNFFGAACTQDHSTRNTTQK